MNTSKVKMLEEREDHFRMHDGTAEFRVPKNGLSEALHGRIRKMAGGGSVDTLPDRKDAGAPVFTFDPHQYDVVPAPAAQAPQSFTGAELGLGTDRPIPANAAISMPTPASPLALAPGMKPAQAAEKTFEDTGTRSADGQPVLREVDAVVDRPLPTGLRLKGAQQATAATPAPVSKPAGVGGGGGGGALPGLAEVEKGARDERTALQAEAAAKVEQAKATAAAIAEGDKVLQEHAVAQKQRANQARASADELMRKHEAATDAILNADTTIDPGRFWASRTTGQKISGIIGLVLGALGTGPDGINKAAVMLNQAVDRDIDAQKSEHALRMQKGKTAVEAAQTAYAMNHQIFNDDLAADAATHATAMQQVDNKLKQISAAGLGPQAQAQADALSARLQAETGKFKSQAANIAFDNTTQRISANAQAAAAGAKAGGLDNNQKDLLLEVESRNRTIQQNGAKLMDLIDAYGTQEKLAPGVEVQMRQLATDMAVDAAKLKDPNSVVRPSEMEQEISNIFSPGFMQRSATAKAQIKAMMKNSQERRDTSYGARGMK